MFDNHDILMPSLFWYYYISPTQDLDKIVKLISEARYLAAHELFIETLRRVDEAIDLNEEEKTSIKNSLHYDQHVMTLLKRVAEVKQALDYHDTSDGWIYGSSMLGITTYYRTSPGDNCITIKMEGAIEDLPTIEQFAVIREIDLFQDWIPFCSQSVLIDKIGQADYFA